MPFSKEDFTAENAQRISVIIMPRMKKHALTSFRSLDDRLKAKFNKLMNEYIASLGEDWEPKLLHDFNEVCYDEIFVDNFNPEAHAVPMLDTEVKLLLSEDQKAWLESEKQNVSVAIDA
jgi:hypothetical protein